MEGVTLATSTVNLSDWTTMALPKGGGGRVSIITRISQWKKESPKLRCLFCDNEGHIKFDCEQWNTSRCPRVASEPCGKTNPFKWTCMKAKAIHRRD